MCLSLHSFTGRGDVRTVPVSKCLAHSAYNIAQKVLVVTITAILYRGVSSDVGMLSLFKFAPVPYCGTFLLLLQKGRTFSKFKEIILSFPPHPKAFLSLGVSLLPN